jgi:hypothetical protein
MKPASRTSKRLTPSDVYRRPYQSFRVHFMTSVILKHVDRILKHVVMNGDGRKREVEATKKTMSPADSDELHIRSLTAMFVLLN